MNRRRFLGLMALAPAALAVDSVGFAPRELAVAEGEVAVPGLPAEFAGLRVGVLSDFHAGRVSLDLAREAVRLLDGLAPDLVCLPGDLVDGDPAVCGPLAAVLGTLRPRLGTFACPGNHDHRSRAVPRLKAELAAHGVALLVNASQPLAGNLWVAGLDDPWLSRPDLDAALAGVPSDACSLLLCHAPDYADRIAARPFRIPLQLSGHSHGGQVALPGVGPVKLPPLGRKYHTGLYRVENTDRQVYTTRGVGHTLPIRLNCPPEVTLLTLRPA
ncbi:MAG: metallophosphoesterase [Thermodesulfobacteriota bacterium]